MGIHTVSGFIRPRNFRLGIRPYAFTPDGKTLLTVERNAAGNRLDIGKLTLMDEPSHEPLLNEPYAERWPALSPDGRFMAYAAEERGECRSTSEPSLT